MRDAPFITHATGVQGCGKDSLIDDISSILEADGLKVHVAESEHGFKSIQRWAQSLGLPINEKTTFKTQYYLAIANMEADMRHRLMAKQEGADIVLMPRSVCDVIPYTAASDNITKEEYRQILSIIFNHMIHNPVDILLAPDPLTQIAADGVRSLSLEFQKKIGGLFKSTWDVFKLDVVNVPLFSDIESESRKERTKYCVKEIKARMGMRVGV